MFFSWAIHQFIAQTGREKKLRLRTGIDPHEPLVKGNCCGMVAPSFVQQDKLIQHR
jgi:hypothetical protein